jgi:hypothetical protein
VVWVDDVVTELELALFRDEFDLVDDGVLLNCYVCDVCLLNKTAALSGRRIPQGLST